MEGTTKAEEIQAEASTPLTHPLSYRGVKRKLRSKIVCEAEGVTEDASGANLSIPSDLEGMQKFLKIQSAE